MPATEHRLRVVAHPGMPPRDAHDLGRDGEIGDVVLTAAIFAVFAAPLVGALAHVGRWGDGTLGLGAAGAVLAGRELWACLRAVLRERRRP